ncbi:MAG: hypothetical protein ACRDAX_06375 [Propionibacteriaceae bacterium]
MKNIVEPKMQDEVAASKRSASTIIKRQRILLVVTTLAALLAVGALIVSMNIKSPAQRASEQAPPEASLITEQVTKERIVRSLVVRGKIEATAVDVRAISVSSAERLVLTGLPIGAGQKVNQGDVVAQLSGRPIMAWRSTVPFYRDIKPGMVGADIDALRTNLVELGLLAQAVSGEPFGPATQEALLQHYRNRGYSAQTTDDFNPAAASERKSAERFVVEARRAVTDATDSSAKKRAEEDLARAVAEQNELAANSGVVIPISEIAAIPSLPASVSAIKASIGTDMAASSDHIILSIATGDPIVKATAPLGEKGSLAVGQNASITDEVLGTNFEAKIVSVEAGKQETSTDNGIGMNQGSGNSSTDLQIVLAAITPIKAEAVGDDVRVAITLKSSEAEVLAVPLNAIATRDDNTSYVTVIDGQGTKKEITVKVGIATENKVEIEALDGVINVSDRVVIA